MIRLRLLPDGKIVSLKLLLGRFGGRCRGGGFGASGCGGSSFGAGGCRSGCFGAGSGSCASGGCSFGGHLFLGNLGHLLFAMGYFWKPKDRLRVIPLLFV